MRYFRNKLQRRDFHNILGGALGMAAIGSAYSAGQLWASPPSTEPGSVTPTRSQFRAASNLFAANFLNRVYQGQPKNNQFFSPFSIEAALVMTMEGARGPTAFEMGTALAFPQSLRNSTDSTAWQLSALRNELQAIVRQFYRNDAGADEKVRATLSKNRDELAKLNQQAVALQNASKFNEAMKLSQRAQQLAMELNELSKTIDQYELSNANGLWVERSYELHQEFIDRLRQSYGAAMESVDFKNNADAERGKINQWISDRTKQKVNNIIPPNAVGPDTRLILANAIYFRGTWQHPFDASQTTQQPFFNLGSQSVSVPMMSKFGKLVRYAAFNADGTLFDTPRTLPRESPKNQGYPQNGFQLLELGYNGDDLSMWIALPSERTGLSALLNQISGSTLDQWDSALSARDVQISLPKFKLEQEYDLRSNLQQLGMMAAFDPQAADFSGMSLEKVFISKVIHKTFVDVNEKGTEAAAATVVMMNPASAVAQLPFVPEFKADHPFLFLIRHRPSGVILFVGLVQQL